MKNFKLTKKAKKKLIKRFVIAGTIAAIAVDYFTVANNTNTKSHKHELYNHLSNVNVVTLNKEYYDNDTVMFYFDDGSLATCANEKDKEVCIEIPTETKYISTTALNKEHDVIYELPELKEDKTYNFVIDCKNKEVKPIDYEKYKEYKEEALNQKEKNMKLPDYNYGTAQTGFLYDHLDVSDICEDHFRAQGACRIDNKLYISAHFDSKLYPFEKEKNSRIYIFDIITGHLINFLSLDNKDHLGGLIYDYQKNRLFVSSSNGKANAYDLITLSNIINNYNSVNNVLGTHQKEIDFDTDQSPIKSVLVDNDIDVSDITVEGRNSTMCYCENSIYVATYDNTSGGEIIKYNKPNNLKVYEKYDTDICYIQGIAAIQYDGNEYIITSSSLPMGGTDFVVQKVVEDRFGYKTLQRVSYYHIRKNGGQGLFIDNNKNVVCVFEGGLFGGNSGDVYSINFKKLLDKGVKGYQPTNLLREMADYLNTDLGPSVDEKVENIKKL